MHLAALRPRNIRMQREQTLVATMVTSARQEYESLKPVEGMRS